MLDIENDVNLVRKFNGRDYNAYSDVYTLIYKSIYYYSYSLYRGTSIDCEDIIQDIFLEIWENKHLHFESVGKIKSYVFVAIKHKFLMYCRKRKFVDTVMSKMNDDDYFVIQAAESEIYSIIPEALNILPADCAESFRMFIEGDSIKEIAEKLKKPLSTIYSQRERSITILKARLPRDKFRLIMCLIIGA